jgi:hypothetical protein
LEDEALTLFGIHFSAAVGNALGAGVFALMAVSSLISGTSGAGAFILVKRSEEPAAFWFFVVGWGSLALLFGYWAVIDFLRGTAG